MRNYNTKSNVEKVFLDKNKELKNINSKNKRIFTLQLSNPDELGKFIALRFLEWLQLNPKGVIALPTGNTPKTFIEHTINFLNNWNSIKIQKELEQWGVDQNKKPDMKSFYFVQLDEFFPIDPKEKNSFAYFINEFYINGFGLDRSKCLMMDVCYEDSSVADAEKFATDYEEKIKNLGGIGFLLGGIGPDGHIAFNLSGSDHKSKTRLLKINYQTAAVLAKTFGGINNSRDKIVMTVGLQTITQNETTTAIIIASSRGKAEVVKNAVTNNPSKLYPATALQKLNGSRFYITKDAAFLLEESKEKLIKAVDIKNKIKTDFSEFNNKKILHTSPHHDDIMLGYFPFIEQLVAETNCKHHFTIATSGFDAVPDRFLNSKTINQKDEVEFKSQLREKEEEEKLWGHIGFKDNVITHLRLPFYKTKKIVFDKDVVPVINLLQKVNPDFVSVCMDVEGMGPGTHFKVLQIVKMAVKEYLAANSDKKIKIIGYRNVWSKFYLWEANFFVPVNNDQLNSLKTSFHEFYKTQEKPMFPSIEYDESFDVISLKIMKEQYEEIKKYLGEGFFKKNKNQKLKEATGFCFLKVINPDLFFV